MHPIICKIGPFTIYSYGLALALAFVTGSQFAKMKARKEGVSPEIVFNLVFTAFIWGIIGARFLYVLQNLGHYLKEPLEIIMLQHGGLSWFGGLIAGVLSAAVYLKVKKLSVYKITDLIIPFVALAQAIGRVGCFLNGCCYGKSIFIPTQIYSSLLLLLIFVVLRFLQDRPHKDGQVFFAYLFLYSIKRFFMEFLRGDNEIIFLGLTLFQIMSIALFFLAGLSLLTISRKKN